jgi:hypothetical protein
VESLLADLANLTPCDTPDSDAAVAFLKEKGVRPVDMADWRRIDEAEIERGKAIGKPREKFTTIEEMLAVLD